MTTKEILFIAVFGYASPLLILGGYLMSAIRQILESNGKRYPEWAWILVSLANALVCGMAVVLMFVLSVIAIAPQDGSFATRAGVYLAGLSVGLVFVFSGIHLISGWLRKQVGSTASSG